MLQLPRSLSSPCPHMPSQPLETPSSLFPIVAAAQLPSPLRVVVETVSHLKGCQQPCTASAVIPFPGAREGVRGRAGSSDTFGGLWSKEVGAGLWGFSEPPRAEHSRRHLPNPLHLKSVKVEVCLPKRSVQVPSLILANGNLVENRVLQTDVIKFRRRHWVGGVPYPRGLVSF